MRWSPYVQLTVGQQHATSAWTPYDSGVPITNDFDAVDAAAPGASANFPGSPTLVVSRGLFLSGFENLIPKIGKTARIYALQVQFTGSRAGSSQAMSVAGYTSSIHQPEFDGPAFMGAFVPVSGSPYNFVTTPSTRIFTLGSGVAGDLLGLESAGTGSSGGVVYGALPTGDAPYTFVDVMERVEVVVKFAAGAAPGVVINVWNAQVRALFSSGVNFPPYVI